MHLSKKGKLILLTTIPSAAIVTSLAVLTPIVIINEQKTWYEIDNSKNIRPKFVSKAKIEEILKSQSTSGYSLLEFNPENYSREFFIDKIANKQIKYFDKETNKPVTIDSNEVLFDKLVDPNHKDVVYKINYVGYLNNRIEANITKSHNGKSKSYTEVVKSSDDWTFQIDPSISMNNFLSFSIPNFKKFIKEGIINIDAKNVSSSNVEEIQQANLSFSSNSQAITIDPQNHIDDDTNIFSYDSNEKISFEILPSGSKVYARGDAWPIINVANEDPNYVNNGFLDFEKSELFKFLYQEYQANKSCLVLPELTEENYESNYSYIVNTKVKKFTDLTLEEREKLQIARIIFDPFFDPFSKNYLSEQKMPNSQFCALVVKMKLGKSFVYAVVWQNILQSSNSSIVSSAPEIGLMIKKELVQNPPTAQEIVDSKNYDYYFSFVEQFSQSLQYKIVNVEIPTENNEQQTKVIATIKVYSLEDSEINPKEYKATIEKNIKGLDQQKLDSTIEKLLGNNFDLTPITPSATITSGGKPTSAEDLIIELNKLVSNPTEFNKKVVLTKRSGTESLDYIPSSVLWYSESQIQIVYSIVSASNNSITPTNPNYKNVTVIVNVV